MNLGMIRFLLGRILMVVAVMMLPSIGVSLFYHESVRIALGFLYSIGLIASVGWLLGRKRPKEDDFYAREGLALVALAWGLISLAGALPFFFSGAVSSFTDALFESTSGFSTTGASVLRASLTSLPRSLLFWRSFTLLLGGMGMLVFIVSILPTFGSKGIFIMRAELPGPTFGKLESRVSSSIYILTGTMIIMMLILIVLLRLGGVPWFDSVLLALGVAGTGGFNFYPNSVAHYGSSSVEIVLAIAMLVFGMSYHFFYLIVIGKGLKVLKSEELRWYLGIVILAVLIIAVSLSPYYDQIGIMLKDVFFTVTSVLSTTAYTTVDFRPWPVITHVVLLFLMFSGGMSGSTSSGLKVARIAVFLKSIRQEIRRMVNPDRAVPIKFEGRELGNQEQRSTAFYLMTYLGVFLILLALISLDTKTFASAFSGVISTLNNVGGDLDLLGPAVDYAHLHDRTKLIMCLAMIMGRLEIYPVLLLFPPATWRKT